ncbi:unnamed protein product [Dibothriocephalus latus]|uniref:Reverse transcriptase domain-containing protein n=1 Tax=Dibothriocephalus latus TaxID=60516 RepID=A0A3P6Q0F9_DIBLA|nr:unnamed protein product [Dibothriocephalus latus]
MMRQLTENNRLIAVQPGFLEKRSCDTCQLSFFEYVLQSRDNGFALYTVCFDFTKAFNRVDHNLLLLKLASFGIGKKLLNSISSYLDARTKRVRVSNVIFNPTHVTSDVLRPLLFCLFVNDVPDCFQNGRSLMYADDLEVAYQYEPADFNIVLELIKRIFRPLPSGAAHDASPFHGTNVPSWFLATIISLK